MLEGALARIWFGRSGRTIHERDETGSGALRKAEVDRVAWKSVVSAKRREKEQERTGDPDGGDKVPKAGNKDGAGESVKGTSLQEHRVDLARHLGVGGAVLWYRNARLDKRQRNETDEAVADSLCVLFVSREARGEERGGRTRETIAARYPNRRMSPCIIKGNTVPPAPVPAKRTPDAKPRRTWNHSKSSVAAGR